MLYNLLVLLICHILIACSSLLFTGYLFLWPSVKKLQISYSLVGLTILSGTILIIQMPSHMVSACFAGLLYLGFVTAGISLANRKLKLLNESKSAN